MMHLLLCACVQTLQHKKYGNVFALGDCAGGVLQPQLLRQLRNKVSTLCWFHRSARIE